MRIIAIDTETEGPTPWSVQWSEEPGTGYIWFPGTDLPEPLAALEQPGTLTVVHNALFDIPVLWQCGIRPTNYTDTMLMAYILGLDSMGLKNLAYRYCGVEMRSYSSVVEEAAQLKALRYLTEVISREWPDPTPVTERKANGDYHIRFPTNIKSRVKRLLKKYHTDSTIDLREKWNNMDNKEQVIQALGDMPLGYLSDIPRNEAIRYACMDADATLRVYHELLPLITDAGLQEPLNIDLATVEMISTMMTTGARIDPGKLEQLRTQWTDQMHQIIDTIEDLCGHYVNPASSQQVAATLYERGEVDKPDISTAAKILDKIAHTSELASLVQDYRGYQTLVSRYTTSLIEKADADDRLHTSYSMTRTETARLASSNPNLQNIPVRSADGREVRKAFIATEGYKLVAVDYSQVELRMCAHISQDTTLLSVYRTGGDIHETTRHGMFGGPPNDQQRKYAKVVNFATIYGVTARGLLDAMIHAGIRDVTSRDCQHFIDTFYHTYPGYADWVAETRAYARRNRAVRNPFDRMKLVPQVGSSNEYIREEGYRQAVNFPIQAGAGDVLKIAMRELTPLTTDWSPVARPILQVHDELVFEIQDWALDLVIPEIVSVMTNCIRLSVPLKVDVEIGTNWGELEEYTI